MLGGDLEVSVLGIKLGHEFQTHLFQTAGVKTATE